MMYVSGVLLGLGVVLLPMSIFGGHLVIGGFRFTTPGLIAAVREFRARAAERRANYPR